MKVQEKVLVISGAPLEGLNPLPKFRSRKPNVFDVEGEFPDRLKVGIGNYSRVLPYLMQDRYSRKRIPLKLKCLVLENEYLKAEFLPQFGGRLHSLYDKTRGVDLVFKNTVIQPCNLAIRNAWLSGGIEWNIGSFGHTFTTCDNVFCAKLKDGDGCEFIRIYEFERLKGLFWQVDFHLPDGSKYLITHVKMINPFNEDTTTYWWSNVAVPEDNKTRVLSSETKVISFVSGAMRYETLPYIEAMPNVDTSYPSNANRAFDYFIQAENPTACTWESAVYKNGVALFEISTPPLTCKKLFCWGNHFAGDHWQEFLSEKGKGFYAEIQAGIAPSQLHDYKIGAKETLEWTQCYGGVEGDPKILHSDDYEGARLYLGGIIDKALSTDEILALNEKLKIAASLPVNESDILHSGSGFGALEIMRIEKYERGTSIPSSMCFPKSTIGKDEAPWKFLIENGILPKESARCFTPSYTVSDKWIALIKDSFSKPDGKTWYSLMQYGTAIYDYLRLDDYAMEAYSDEDNEWRTAEALSAWEESLKLEESYIVYRNIAVLMEQRGDVSAAEEYYRKALKCDGAYDDFALLSEFLILLNASKKYDAVWALFESAPDNCKSADRIRINAAKAAVKLDKFEYLEAFFKEDHYDIREGENPLTDIWFEYHARKVATERNIDLSDNEKMEEIYDEVTDSFPPPYEIDFRMSLDKKIKYRVN